MGYIQQFMAKTESRRNRTYATNSKMLALFHTPTNIGRGNIMGSIISSFTYRISIRATICMAPNPLILVK